MPKESVIQSAIIKALHADGRSDLFWSHVDKNGPVPEYAPELGPCWIWKAAKNKAGYGAVQLAGMKVGAHRAAYLQEHGEIAQGLHLDHLCRVRACVRPSHLEPVTIRENLLRGETFQAANVAKTHCPSGHPLSGENLHIYAGRRICKECKRTKSREFRRKKFGYAARI